MKSIILATLLALASLNAQACKLNVDCTPLGAAPASNDVMAIEHIADPTKKQMTVANLFTAPTFTTPVLGVATATSVNKVTLTVPATGSTLTIADGKTLTVNNTLTMSGTDSTTMTFPTTSATIARTDAANTFTGTQTFNNAVQMNSTLALTGINSDAYITGNFLYGYANKNTARTADLTLNSSTHVSNTYTNAGSSADIVLTLPNTFVGDWYRAVVTDNHYMKFKAQGSDVIYNGASVSSAAGYIRSTTVGSSITLELAVSGKWYVTAVTGTWTIDS